MHKIAIIISISEKNGNYSLIQINITDLIFIFFLLYQVASRLVFGLFPCILILFAIIGKLAAVFITIPYPVLGGVQIIGFGIFIGLVMSNLQYIDIHSTRNLAIIGISTLLGLMLPFWAKGNADAIDTGKSIHSSKHSPSLINNQ